MVNHILLIVNIAFCLFFIIRGMMKTERIYLFSFSAMVVNLIFILLPCFSYLNEGLAAIHLPRFLIMVLLSEIAIVLGEQTAMLSAKTTACKVQHRCIIPHRWSVSSLLFSFIGLVAYNRVTDLFYAGQNVMTGSATAFGFFTVFLHYGFIMAALGFFYLTHTPLWLKLLSLLPGFYYFGSRIIFFGRRQNIIEFFFIVALVIWYVFRKKPSRISILIAIICGAMIILSIGEYRKLVVVQTRERHWEDLENIEWAGSLTGRTDSGSSETLTSIYQMAAIDMLSQYDFGKFHWNTLVFNYVPAQLLGREFKQSLMFDLQHGDWLYRYFLYKAPTGTTVCGVTDCYRSFWYFGAFKFFLIAWIMARIYRHSMGGDIRWQAIYMYIMTMALHAITHHTNWFINPWVIILLVWLPLMNYCTKENINNSCRAA